MYGAFTKNIVSAFSHVNEESQPEMKRFYISPQINKFQQMVQSIGRETLVATATAGPAGQVNAQLSGMISLSFSNITFRNNFYIHTQYCLTKCSTDQLTNNLLSE